MPLLEFSGVAVITALEAGVGPADTSFELKNGGGWPTGAIAPFIATLGDPLLGEAEEKVLVTSRTGDTLNGITRGYDGTPAQSWGPNTRIRHTIAANFMAELSAHVHDDTRHDHGQYLRALDHAAIAHTEAMLGPDSVGTSELIDGSVTQAIIADDAVGTPEIQDNAIVQALMADASVGTAELIDANVTTPKLANDAVTKEKTVAARGIVRQLSLDTPPAAPYTGDTVTDMVLTNVPVVAGRTYGIHLHAEYDLDIGSTYVIEGRVNGTVIDRFWRIEDEGTVQNEDTIDATIYWTPSVTQATDDIDVYVRGIAGFGALNFTGTGDCKRTLTLIDMSIPTP